MSLFDPEACDDLYCDVKVSPICDFCKYRHACDNHSFRQPDGTRACRTCHYSGRPARAARESAVDRRGSSETAAKALSPLSAAVADMRGGPRPLSGAEKESFYRTLLDECLAEQDQVVVAAVGEFLESVKRLPEPITTGSNRVEISAAKFMRSARFEDQAISFTGWTIYHTDSRSSSEGTIQHPRQTIFIREDGAILAHLPSSEGMTDDLAEHHHVGVLPGQAKPAAYVTRYSQWFARKQDPRSGLPFNVHVHNSTLPELAAGRWAAGHGNSLLSHPKFEEMVPEDATASGNWLVLRLAAYLDDPSARRDQWAQRI